MKTYYAWANNDSGATTAIPGRFGSQRACEDAARAQFGSGWTIHVMAILEIDPDGCPLTKEIRRFRIR